VRRFFGSLYVQVLIGLGAGIVTGAVINAWYPQAADYLKPLGDLFVRLIKMIIGPIILCTVVVGIARAGSAKTVGRLGGKALIYFEVVTTIALGIGLAVGHIFKPGVGLNVDPATLDPAAAANYVKTAPAAPDGSSWLKALLDFFVNMTPSNIVDSFAKGEIVQILVFAVLLGMALTTMGKRAEKVIDLFDDLGHALLRIIGFVMRIAPIAAFGAMAFTIGKFGLGSLQQLGLLIACLYGACAIFIFLVLWPICAFWGRISLWKLVKYLREELFITLGTASSEAVLPRMLEKMQKLGCDKQVVGLVIPAGYSFNLAGSTLYMPLATLFIAQALNIELSLETQVAMFAALMITSKGIAGVAGASMAVLVTTLQSTEVLPVAGLTLVLGIDRIQNEVRSLTNLIGNAIATVVMARSEKAFDEVRARAVLNGQVDVEHSLESGEDLPLPEPGRPSTPV
jgi:aerobic C4-dicarboxylate transport protein